MSFQYFTPNHWGAGNQLDAPWPRQYIRSKGPRPPGPAGWDLARSCRQNAGQPGPRREGGEGDSACESDGYFRYTWIPRPGSTRIYLGIGHTKIYASKPGIHARVSLGMPEYNRPSPIQPLVAGNLPTYSATKLGHQERGYQDKRGQTKENEAKRR